MELQRCNLCSHIYDESKETKKWGDLPDYWVCPICGSPKSSFSIVKQTKTEEINIDDNLGNAYQCNLCSNIYDETNEKQKWIDVPGDWLCSICGSGKTSFSLINNVATKSNTTKKEKKQPLNYLSDWCREVDEFEVHMSDIHNMAIEDNSISEPMRTRILTVSWDEILIKGAQLAKKPLNKSHPVSVKTIIGPNADAPLELEIPLFVTHMSFGALSREAKLALSKGSAKVKTAMCSGEGGIIPESLNLAYKYIFEYVPNKYSVTDENLKKVDAVEIKIGQSAKPGMGGHLPGHKVTEEIADIRGFKAGEDITSPASFSDINTREDLKNTVDMLRVKTGGKPIGIKLAAGHLEEDIEFALFAGVDFITVDGRAGGTGSALKLVKMATSIPSIFALARARQILDEKGAKNVSLIITGGLRISPDFAKAIAMGADAIALGTSAMMALGCQQYRICNTGMCPVGIATQNEELRSRLDIDKSAERVANFFKVCTDELKDFARLTGNENVHNLSVSDLCSTNSEISDNTLIKHV